LSAGTYTVTVMDANDCSTTAMAEVTEPLGIEMNVTATHLDCSNDDSGTSEVTATGGTGSLTYAWSNGNTGITASGLTLGTYTVTVTDESNCSATEQVAITAASDCSSLGNYVWLDMNGDGVQDDTEEGIENVKVELYYADGTFVAETTTDENGFYLFDDLQSGNYYVVFTAPEGLTTTTAGEGDDTKDSDADVVTGQTADIALGAGEFNETIDAGYYELVNLGDFVWLDLNSDGDYDDGETPLANIPVKLYDGNGDFVAQTTTDENGVYGFGDLPPGTYTVSAPNFGPDGEELTTLNNQTTTLLSGEEDLTLDFGYGAILNALGDFVWFDENKDGIQDDGETGIEGVTVTLYNADTNEELDSKETDENGSYLFTGLPDGNYYVVFEGVAGMDRTETEKGDDTANDSDADANGQSQTVALSGGETNLDIDAGYYFVTSLGDFVWLDTDRDGIQDDGEAGIEGVEVTLYDANTNEVLEVTTTDENGFYIFENLDANDYYVVFGEVDGYLLSPSNETDDGNDSDADENGKSPIVTLALGEINMTIDAGFFPICGLTFSTPNVGDCDYNTNNDSSETTVTVTISWSNALPGDQMVVTAGSDTRTMPIGETSGSFNFEFVVPATGNSASIVASMGSFCLENVAFITPEPCEVFNSLGDFVWLDNNGNGLQDTGEAGIEGVQVTLFNADTNGSITSTSTDENGFYLFDNLPDGNYFVVFGEVDDFNRTTANEGNDANDSDAGQNGQTESVNLTGGESDLTFDAGYYQPVTIGDFIWLDLDGDGELDEEEEGLSGITVTLLDENGNVVATTTTNNNGNYTFNNLPPGTYTVSVPAIGPNGETPSIPTTITHSLVSGETNLTYDFAYAPVFNSIGDFVWLDNNGDGMQGTEERGIEDVRVILFNADTDEELAVTLTDENGFYLFDGLVDGSYYIVFDTVEGLGRSDANQGDDRGDSDADENGQSHTVDLAGGEDDRDVDAAYFEGAWLGDFVWLDENGDGIQDDGEVGLQGVTLTLFDEDGNVVGTTTSDENGFYTFTDLAPGTYTVTVSTVGPNGESITTDAAMTATILSGEHNDTLDFGYQTEAAPLGALGDFVWLDNNGNGIQDAGDAGVEGIEVELFDANTGESLGTTTTGEFGQYLFTELTEGNYYVQFNLPQDYQTSPQFEGEDFRADSNADENGQSDIIALGEGEQNLTIDAGIYMPAQLGDFVWLDANGDGLQDNGENGIEGITVVLLDENGNVLATTTTDENGFYLFDNLVPGTYSVLVPPALPTGEEPTTFIQMSATLASGDVNLDLDFGYWIPPVNALGDFVWLDENADGIQNEGEPGLEDIIVNIYDANTGELVNSTATDENGFYWFDGLANGDYYIELNKVSGTLEVTDQNGGTDGTNDSDINSDLTSDVVTLEGGIDYPDLDAGLFEIAGLGGTVWLDTDGDGIMDLGENGIEGVPVTLLDGDGNIIATTLTNADGNYSFNGLTPGEYTVIVPDLGPNGEDLTTIGELSTVLFSGDYVDDLDFGYQPNNILGSIGDFVWYDLDGDGLQDAGENGIEGITITLILPDGTILTTQTDVTGFYVFSDLPAGNYEVIVGAGPEGTSLTTANSFNPLLGEGDQFLIADFGFIPVEELLGSIGDTIWFDIDGDGDLDSFEIGLGSVSVTIYNAAGEPIRTVESDLEGHYLFDNLPEGEYTVIVDETTAPEGLVPSTTTSVTYDLSPGEIYLDANFGFTIDGGGAPFEYCAGDVANVELCVSLNENEVLVSDGDGIQSVLENCVNYTPQVSEGTEIVSLTICQEDNLDDCRQEVYLLAVGCVPPNAVNDAASITPTSTTINGSVTSTTAGFEGINVNVFNNDYDMCYEGWTTAITEQPANGTATISPTGIVDYVPNEGFSGTDEVTYQICNECGSCNNAILSIDVELPCESEDINICVAPITPIEICPDFCLQGAYEITSATTTYNCSLQIADECITYTALPLFAGDDIVEIIACTLDGATCDTIYVNVIVSNDCGSFNNPPIAIDDSAVSPLGNTVMIDVIGNDSDPDGDIFTITSITEPSSGVLTIINGMIEYTPIPGYVGEDEFTYQICDPSGACDIATVSLEVTGKSCEDSLYLCAEPLEPLVICPDFCDLPDSDNVTITSASTTYSCSLQLLDNGCLQYTALPLFAGEEIITIVGCNAFGQCDTSYAVIQVTGCNGDGPGKTHSLQTNASQELEEPAMELTLNSILPVPAKDFITINFSMVPGDATIEVFNLTGQSMAVNELSSAKTQNMLRLDVADYPVGIYVVSIKAGGEIISSKFVKR